MIIHKRRKCDIHKRENVIYIKEKMFIEFKIHNRVKAIYTIYEWSTLVRNLNVLWRMKKTVNCMTFIKKEGELAVCKNKNFTYLHQHISELEICVSQFSSKFFL